MGDLYFGADLFREFDQISKSDDKSEATDTVVCLPAIVSGRLCPEIQGAAPQRRSTSVSSWPAARRHCRIAS
jgi:hypothetical protein